MVATVLEHAGHFTAVDAHERLRSAGERCRATVYRALGLPRRPGSSRGTTSRTGSAATSGRSREHHDHLICLDCRAVVEFQNPAIEELQDKVLKDHGFTMVHHALTIFASCAALRTSGTCARRDAERRTSVRGTAKRP
jgi:Fur family ferric uptake transcriptional regulator